MTVSSTCLSRSSRSPPQVPADISSRAVTGSPVSLVRSVHSLWKLSCTLSSSLSTFLTMSANSVEGAGPSTSLANGGLSLFLFTMVLKDFMKSLLISPRAPLENCSGRLFPSLKASTSPLVSRGWVALLYCSPPVRSLVASRCIFAASCTMLSDTTFICSGVNDISAVSW